MTITGISANIPAATDMTISIAGVVNPKVRSTYSIPITVVTSTGCNYASGTSQVVINVLSSLLNYKTTPSNFFLNTMVPYYFEVTPKTVQIDTGDYINLVLPTGIQFLVDSLTCSKNSANLVSVSCTFIDSKTIKATINLIPTAYVANKTIAFTVSFIMNPSSTGTLAGFFASLRTAADIDYETYSSFYLPYSGALDNIATTIAYTSQYRGVSDTTKYSVQLNSYLPPNTKLSLAYSSKFNISGVTITSSSPVLTIASQSATTRVLELALTNAALPNTLISFTLQMPNPIVELVGAEDLTVQVFFVNSATVIGQVQPMKTQYTFICDALCKECGSLYTTCTSCFANFSLKGTTCVKDQVVTPPDTNVTPVVTTTVQKVLVLRAAEKSIPFIYLGISVLLALVMLITGACLKKRTFWGNCLYSMLKVVFFIAMLNFALNPQIRIVIGCFAYYIYQNEDPKWYLYCYLGIIGMHLLISLVAFIFIRRGIKQASFGKQVSQNKYLNKFVSSARPVDSKTSEEKFGTFFYIGLYFSILFSFSLMRWHFSAAKDEKGAFWYYDTPSFHHLKTLLQRFQMLYIFLVLISSIVLTSLTLGINIYLFKIEIVALATFDLIVYAWAYFELNSFKTGDEEEMAATKLKPAQKIAKGYEAPDTSKADKSALLDSSHLDKDPLKVVNARLIPKEDPELGERSPQQSGLVSTEPTSRGPSNKIAVAPISMSRPNAGPGNKISGIETPLPGIEELNHAEDQEYTSRPRAPIPNKPIPD